MIHNTAYPYWFEICCVGAALFIVSNLWFYFRVLRPIRLLALQAAALTDGRLDAFEQPFGGIAEIRHLRRAMAGMVGHVRRSQDQNRAYTERLTSGLEYERKRLARELHDDAVQSVIAVTQGLDLAKSWLRTDPERAAKMLQTMREQSLEVVNSLHQLISGLRPAALEELGLIAALQMHIDRMGDSGIELHLVGIPRRLDESRELTLFRVAQEALTNVTRHSGATRVELTLTYRDQEVSLAVVDNGQGFQFPEEPGNFAFKGHYGLLGIQERVISLGGSFHVETAPGQGTRLKVRIPVGTAQPHQLVRDPVCSALIEPMQAYDRTLYQGITYYFCCPVCQGAFHNTPDLFVVHLEPDHSVPVRQ